MNQNKIKNTKVGDDIHFYVNGVEDRGIVVKMNNDYVTVFKESTQNYDDIHINDTFFIKDIMVNKEWNDCSDQERYDMLVKIHAPSPRYLQKTWEELPRDMKELLRKNNSNQQGFKLDDDENITARTFDQQKTDPKEIDNNFGKQSLKAEDTEKASSGDINTKRKPKEGEEGADHTTTTVSGGFKENQHIANQKENPNIGEGKNITTRQHGTQERERSTEEEKGVVRGTNADTGSGDAWMKYFKESQSKKAWNTWLEERHAQINKDGAPYQERKEPSNKPMSAERRATGADAGTESSRQDAATSSRQRGQANIVGGTGGIDPAKETSPKSGKGIFGSEATGRADHMGDDYFGDSKGAKEGQGALGKSWEELIAEVKSSVENSVHGNAARNPTAGVNTNTSFDAPADYEGHSHSGVRPEQFKHEEKKPKVGQEKKKKDVKVDDKPADRVNSQTNKYETNQENKDTDGRATNQVKDKI